MRQLAGSVATSSGKSVRRRAGLVGTVWACLVSLVTAPCLASGVPRVPDRADLERQVRALHEARAAWDLRACYEMLAPDVKKLMSFEAGKPASSIHRRRLEKSRT